MGLDLRHALAFMEHIRERPQNRHGETLAPCPIHGTIYSYSHTIRAFCLCPKMTDVIVRRYPMPVTQQTNVEQGMTPL